MWSWHHAVSSQTVSFSHCWVLQHPRALLLMLCLQSEEHELTAAWSLWLSRGLLLSALVTHLTMWPTYECSCLPCDPRDATDSLTTLIMRSGRRRERDCLTGREVGWGERAQREIGHDPADWVRQKSTENYRGRRHREVNMRNNENIRQKTVYRTDGSFWSVCCVDWQMSETYPHVPYVQTVCFSYCT